MFLWGYGKEHPCSILFKFILKQILNNSMVVKKKCAHNILHEMNSAFSTWCSEIALSMLRNINLNSRYCNEHNCHSYCKYTQLILTPLHSSLFTSRSSTKNLSEILFSSSQNNRTFKQKKSSALWKVILDHDIWVSSDTQGLSAQQGYIVLLYTLQVLHRTTVIKCRTLSATFIYSKVAQNRGNKWKKTIPSCWFWGEASLKDKTLYQTTARGPMCPYH